jgi:predicted transcriptional regulator
LRQEKRHKLQLFYEILCGIQEDITHSTSGVAKPTHIQHYSRLSSDKMASYLEELQRKVMVLRNSMNGTIVLTSKGSEFISQFHELDNLLHSTVL